VAVRTLQRQLDSRHTSYSQLLDQLRQQQAQIYIENREMSLLDVAMMLGFAEQSSFARAFKRWFGKAPGAYRRELD
jgi:AraC-like DNA-binding protein